MQREVIRISQEPIKDAYEDTVDGFDLVDDLSLKSMTINELKSSNIKSLTRIKNNIKKGLLSNDPCEDLLIITIVCVQYHIKFTGYGFGVDVEVKVLLTTSQLID